MKRARVPQRPLAEWSDSAWLWAGRKSARAHADSSAVLVSVPNSSVLLLDVQSFSVL